MILDTCAFLWLITDAPDLSPAARDAIRDPGRPVYLSSASVWEISIKYALGKLPLPRSPRQLVPDARTRHRIEALPFDEEDALTVELLPNAHRDPFDRMLIAQAVVRGLPVVTCDPQFHRYPVRILW